MDDESRPTVRYGKNQGHPRFRIVLCLTLVIAIDSVGCRDKPEKDAGGSLAKQTPSVLDGLKAVDVTSVEAKILPYKIGEEEIRVINSQDRTAIEALVVSLVPRTSVAPHKCATAGVITFHKGQEATIVDILPGHDAEYYEVRNPDGRGDYRIPRGPFVKALEAMGVTDIPKND